LNSEFICSKSGNTQTFYCHECTAHGTERLLSLIILGMHNKEECQEIFFRTNFFCGFKKKLKKYIGRLHAKEIYQEI
jgi:hypothetical protein